MKASIIPAQITTVEDRIAANLSFTQLVLLAAPLFMTTIIFFLLPDFGHFSLYKIILAALISIVCSSLALRINGKVLLSLVILRFRYLSRPQLYVYSKKLVELQSFADYKPRIYESPRHIAGNKVGRETTQNSLKSQQLLKDKKYKVAFSAKSGGLNVKVSPS